MLLTGCTGLDTTGTKNTELPGIGQPTLPCRLVPKCKETHYTFMMEPMMPIPEYKRKLLFILWREVGPQK